MAKSLDTLLANEQQRLGLWTRYDAKVIKTPSGCWEWQGAKTPKGYGLIGVGPKADRTLCYAHRLAYWRNTSVDPADMLVLHSCDNPSCCNPDHLSLGTSKANSQDMVAKGRQCQGERTNGSKLRDADIPHIRSDRRSLTTIASIYGVDPKQIHRIKQGVAWRHVE